MGLHDDASTSVPAMNRFDSVNRTQSQTRPVHHCETLSEVVGSHGSSSQRDSVRSAVHETPAVVAQIQGVFPQGESFPHDQGLAALPSSLKYVENALVPVPGPSVGGCLSSRHAYDKCFSDGLGSNGLDPHDQGLAALPSSLKYVENALVPVPGPSVGGCLSSRHAYDRCFSNGLGSNPEGASRSGTMGRTSSLLAHKLPGDDGRVSGLKTLSPRSKGPSCFSLHEQHIGGRLHQPAGGSEVSNAMQTSTSDPPVGPEQNPVHQGNVCPGPSEHGSRSPVEAGGEIQGMETSSPRGGGVHLGKIKESAGRPVCFPRDHALRTMGFSLASSPSVTGCHGSDIAEATSVCFSPDRSAPRSPGEGPSRLSTVTAGSPGLAYQDLVFGPHSPAGGSLVGDPHQQEPSVPGGRNDTSSPTRPVETVGVASEGAHLIENGLSTEVAQTILSSRAPSTWKLYSLKWALFSAWCREHQLNPVSCQVASVLEFLQDRLSAGLAASTLRVYVSAIAAYRSPLDDESLGQDPLICRFLRGAIRLRPISTHRVPTWDLTLVLEGISVPPFEPLQKASDKFLTLKTAFLLAISSLKRVGDLQALSVAPSFLEFAPGMSKAFLYPRPGYVPKVPTHVARPAVLQAFNPPPFQSSDQEKLNLLCPVRALNTYVNRVINWRKSEQLLVCFGPSKRGSPANKQTISNWIVETISFTYQAAGRPAPKFVKAHSTRAVGASKASISGSALSDICLAAGWSTPHT
ncbi:uncharacterized protein [Danio rerio]|uniref:Uncharacterized protein n=1 Tax=Danio rerio TaxID=7955 RepID=A0AC58HE91_DANRE